MTFTLKQIRYFVAVAETGSITEAGRRLHISQPSVSAAIAELEDRFKVDLFIRHHAQGLSLTPAGTRLFKDARSLLDHAEELRQGAVGLGQAMEGDLHIGCFQTFAPIVMPRVIRAFAVAHPAIAITLHEHHVQGVVDGLSAGQFELALTYDLNLTEDLAFEPLVAMPLHAVLARSHRLAREKEVSLEQLTQYPMVLLKPAAEPRLFPLAVLLARASSAHRPGDRRASRPCAGWSRPATGLPSCIPARPASKRSMDARWSIARSRTRFARNRSACSASPAFARPDVPKPSR